MRSLSFLVCLIFFFSLVAGAVFAGDDITITVIEDKNIAIISVLF